MSWYEIVLLINGVVFPYIIYKIAFKIGYKDGYLSCGWETGVWRSIPHKKKEKCVGSGSSGDRATAF